MQNVHPIFQQALAGIAPPADAKHWQAMCIQLRTELTQYDAPRCPRGQFEHVYQHQSLGRWCATWKALQQSRKSDGQNG